MMDKHKDNYCPEELEKIIDRKFNNVILFSAGGNIPMTSKMCYPSRHEQTGMQGGHGEQYKFVLPLGDGWITVLDPK